MTEALAPEQMACACHGRPLHQCPTLNPPITPSPEETMPKKPKTTAKGTTTKAEKIHRRVLVKRVRIGINPEEKDQATTELLAKLKSEEVLEAERKETNSVYRDKLKGLQLEIIELREQIGSGRLEDAEVEETKDFNKRTVTYTLTATGQAVETRDMTEEDDQLELGGAPEPDNDEQED